MPRGWHAPGQDTGLCSRAALERSRHRRGFQSHHLVRPRDLLRVRGGRPILAETARWVIRVQTLRLQRDVYVGGFILSHLEGHTLARYPTTAWVARSEEAKGSSRLKAAHVLREGACVAPEVEEATDTQDEVPATPLRHTIPLRSTASDRVGEIAEDAATWDPVCGVWLLDADCPDLQLLVKVVVGQELELRLAAL